MANFPNMTLVQFLQRDPDPFQHYHRDQSDSTTSNARYQIAAVRNILPWPEFSLGHIVNQFGALLNNVQVAGDAHPITPPPFFAAEDYLREIISIYADRPVRRALTQTFQHLARAPGNQMRGRTPITLGSGSLAKLIDKYAPDRAFYEVPAEESINRLPGEIKPSWKWQSAWHRDGNPFIRARVAARLAQLSYYMLQQGHGEPHSGARYGYMLTDRELVAFRKDDTRGSVYMSQPIPWRGEPEDGTPRLTVLLGLWYLGMLASSDNGWTLQQQPGDPTDEQLMISQSQGTSGNNAASSSTLPQR
ncbi:hypothetical protein NQ176_g4158 [Zarea fungicola]|uniref:Uncharacterized protein n=1 Tax=Zarea fungicola TaxID=93591 RepID=A0ACC1NEW7_9HYPO|nr:hypothetical protein NQ176_g4158 [Lecanicillium fungicola]